MSDFSFSDSPVGTREMVQQALFAFQNGWGYWRSDVEALVTRLVEENNRLKTLLKAASAAVDHYEQEHNLPDSCCLAALAPPPGEQEPT